MIILGCGYIGTALARVALAAGEPVAALTRNAQRAAELRTMGAQPVVEADLADEDWHGQLNPASATIVDSVSPSSKGVEGYRHSFLEGGASIRRWLEKSAAKGSAPARELVFTSSTAVYPQINGEVVDEETPVDVVALSAAGKVLREAEEQFLSLPANLVRRTWVMRLAGLYGPQRHHLLDALRAGEKTFSGGGEHWVNLLHRDDAVGAIRACLVASPNSQGGVFNVADGEPVHKKDLVAWIAEQLGQNPGELIFEASGGGRSEHRWAQGGLIPHRRISAAKLKKVLGWKVIYTSYREGYAKLLG